MLTKYLLIPGLALALLSAAVGKAVADNPPTSADGVRAAAISAQVCSFIDEDGDGFNDLAPDQDGDGIPDRLDPDTKSVQGVNSKARGWLRLSRLFGLMFDQAGLKDRATWEAGQGLHGQTGLGQGPGQRTGFGPDSGDPSGDGVDLGGRSQRRGGKR